VPARNLLCTSSPNPHTLQVAEERRHAYSQVVLGTAGLPPSRLVLRHHPRVHSSLKRQNVFIPEFVNHTWILRRIRNIRARQRARIFRIPTFSKGISEYPWRAFRFCHEDIFTRESTLLTIYWFGSTESC
jgi:hypothetical protein